MHEHSPLASSVPAAPTLQTGQYATQLEGGFNRLVFQEPLEQAYIEHVRRDQYGTLLACIGGAIAAMVFYSGADAWRVGLLTSYNTLPIDVWTALICRWLTLLALILGCVRTIRLGEVPVGVPAIVYMAGRGPYGNHLGRVPATWHRGWL